MDSDNPKTIFVGVKTSMPKNFEHCTWYKAFCALDFDINKNSFNIIYHFLLFFFCFIGMLYTIMSVHFRFIIGLHANVNNQVIFAKYILVNV